ncbi:radical SAM family heme chaperone HemW [Pseudidiomarina insulisalsae]|uniref:Heme chaperone HemW n=1 Tax=Pseudidiomarina insulisalsae TaxID=575789 RepID=A0A432YHT3_9GAMM|nr:radical SAM family heme chaperone HemW [Pseudidiomarina insulisalsae]RUO60488.1 YggW family oxidoreductase [Pseudidiomarina insulisalsae]
MMKLPPLSLYVHIPWCVQKCPYCDFNSHALKGGVPEQAYIARLLDDLRADRSWAQDRPIVSIFIGGGTPSLLSPQAVATLLNGIKTELQLTADCEITLEANPGTFEQERFAGFLQAGVNRLSIGIQSLDEAQLQRLGRIHNPQQALAAAAHARQLPLRSFNLDLMHGLPQQSIAQAMADLDGVIALNPPHISWYQLTIEPNTSFASRPPRLPEDDVLAEISEQGHRKLLAAGYENYEVSAYAKPGHQSRHNRNYWQFGDYLGIGCGAHSKITLIDEARILRCEKIKHPQGYLDLTRPLRYRTWEVDAAELPFEFFMNLLRLAEPITKSLFTERTGLPLAVAEQALAPALHKGLITSSATEWQTTPLGRRFLNSILDEMV